MHQYLVFILIHWLSICLRRCWRFNCAENKPCPQRTYNQVGGTDPFASNHPIMRSTGTEGRVGALVGIERRAVPSAKAVEEAVGHRELTVRSVECAGKQCIHIFSNLEPEWRWKPRTRTWCLCIEDMSQEPGGWVV